MKIFNTKEAAKLIGIYIGGVVSFFVFFYISSYGYFSLSSKILDGRGQYFAEQTNQLLSGKWQVSPGYLAGGAECFNYHNSCMGYFGLFPSFVRLPTVLIFHRQHEFNYIYILIAYFLYLLFSFKALIVMKREILVKSYPLQVLYSIAVGISPMLFLAFRMYMYEEAILWAVAMFSATIYYLLLYSETNRKLFFFIAVICGIFTINSRISEGVGAFSACLLLFLYVERSQYRKRIYWAKFISCFSIPLSYFITNYLKFGVAAPSITKLFGYASDPLRLKFVEQCGVFNLGRGFYGFMAYFFPAFHNWPFGFAYSRNRHPSSNTGLLISRCMEREWWSPISVTYPLLFIFALISIYSIIKHQSYSSPVFLILLGTWVAVLPTICFIGFTERYLSDFLVPLLFLCFMYQPTNQFLKGVERRRLLTIFFLITFGIVQLIDIYILGIRFYQLNLDFPSALFHLIFARQIF